MHMERFINSTYLIRIMGYKFIHKVSRGSRYNQIYIPKEMIEFFHVGDIVRVELLKKKTELFCSNVKGLSKFKERLIKEIFSFLSKFKEINQIFLVGSFLTEKIDYRDIDLIIIKKNGNDNLEEKAYNGLVDKFNLKFHVISIPENKLLELAQICPLIRSMLYHSISNKKFNLPNKKIDMRHIEFLLMMPEDLLEIRASSRVFYDNIRRLEAIENFLNDKELSPEEIIRELRLILGNLFEIMKNNEEIGKERIKELRGVIKIKLESIRRKLEGK